MATLKEIISEIFNTEMDNDERQGTPPEKITGTPPNTVHQDMLLANDQPETQPANDQQESAKTFTEDEIKDVVRDEIKGILAEIKASQVANRQQATMTREALLDNEERTVDDIMSDRLMSLMGATNEKGDKK